MFAVAILGGCARRATTLPPDETATPASIATRTGTAGRLTLLVPLTLDKLDVAPGDTVSGSVTYANLTDNPITIRNLVIAARPASGAPRDARATDFVPGLGAITIAPGSRATLTASRIIGETSSPETWITFSSYQAVDGTWHDASTEYDVLFAAGRSARPIARPRPTATPALSALESATPLYWGAYIDGVPWDLARLDAFEARARRRVSLIHWGQSWWRDGLYQPFYADDFARVRGRGAIPLLTWGSWDDAFGPDQPRFALARVARGDHDAYVRAWAAGAAAWGKPLFLRFNWEMNGWWQFPWSAQLNGNTAADYVAAWRHVHDLFAAAGATNVTWVWCPNVIAGPTTPLASLYPGDAYVDWVALDGYNWGTDYGGRWQSFAEVFGPSYAALRQLATAKPIMIGEIGSQENGGDKAAWIRDALGVQIPARFPAIKALAWFNWDANDPLQVASIESSPAATAAFGETVGGSPLYLQDRFAALDASPIPVPVAAPG